jgi:hypothetical protein
LIHCVFGSGRIERKDRLEVRRLELRRHELLGAEAGYADHAHVAVAPGLGRNPFDEIVAVEGARAAAFRLADTARIADYVHVAARDQIAGVAGLRRTGPQHRPGRMGQRCLRRLGPLQVLVVDRESEQGGELIRRVRTVDVDRDFHAVAHRHQHVLLGDDAGMGRRPVIFDGGALARQ